MHKKGLLKLISVTGRFLFKTYLFVLYKQFGLHYQPLFLKKLGGHSVPTAGIDATQAIASF